MQTLAGKEKILDLGCGNGELARWLNRQGHHAAYTGLDFSLALLRDARLQAGSMLVEFIQADLSSADWDVPFQAGSFQLGFAFAVLHHIPGEDLRIWILGKMHRLLEPGGRLFMSNWQFMNSPRLKKRVRDWQELGLSEENVDPGDFLLDWRAGGQGLRYVHLFNETELDNLAKAASFRICDTFHSDGDGGRLGLYQVWEKI